MVNILPLNPMESHFCLVVRPEKVSHDLLKLARDAGKNGKQRHEIDRDTLKGAL